MISYSFEKSKRWHGKHIIQIENLEIEIPGHPGQQGYNAVPTLYGLSKGRCLEDVVEEVYEVESQKVQSKIIEDVDKLLEDGRMPEKYREDLESIVEEEFDFFSSDTDPGFGVP
ncbi:MAG: hypothetical protein H8Z69_05770 [Nanohaloarchaea archaeon]|nr:hypothetical protein [Candidatus Nanohaloarchaea archaeon]